MYIRFEFIYYIYSFIYYELIAFLVFSISIYVIRVTLYITSANNGNKQSISLSMLPLKFDIWERERRTWLYGLYNTFNDL